MDIVKNKRQLEAFKSILLFAKTMLHAQAQGWDLPTMPSQEDAREWLSDAFVLLKQTQIEAAERLI